MSSIPPRTQYVCKRCIQRLSYHNDAKLNPYRVESSDPEKQHVNDGLKWEGIRLRKLKSVGPPSTLPKPYRADPYDPKKQHVTRRNNGVTWEGMRFRKVKLDEQPSKWDASSILYVGKQPRVVPTGGPPTLQVKTVLTDKSTPEMTRPVGRIRGGRARIPGPVATEYLNSKQTSEDLVPLVPSAPLGILDEAIKRKENEPTASTITKAGYKPGEHFNWYWETLPPSIADVSHGNNFFLKNRNPVKLIRSAARFREVPQSDVPEVAFVGRSNVGKSSLLNAIVDADMKAVFARTSATRGFTKTMNFYGIGPGTGITLKKDETGKEKITGQGVVLVDMPGYGEGSLSSWGVEIMKYFQSRKQLRRIFVLLDAEHGIKEKDRSLLASLRLAGVSHQVILSKMDKIYVPKSKSIYQLSHTKRHTIKSKGTVEALRAKMKSLKDDINPPVGGGALGEILACSSETVVGSSRLGVDHVRYAVLKAVGLEGKMKKRVTSG
jgi:GTP-binding protein